MLLEIIEMYLNSKSYSYRTNGEWAIFQTENKFLVFPKEMGDKILKTLEEISALDQELNDSFCKKF